MDILLMARRRTDLVHCAKHISQVMSIEVQTFRSIGDAISVFEENFDRGLSLIIDAESSDESKIGGSPDHGASQEIIESAQRTSGHSNNGRKNGILTRSVTSQLSEWPSECMIY